MKADFNEFTLLVSVEEIAKILSVPPSWVYRMTAREEIPHIHVGRYVRFYVHEVMEWIRSQSEESSKQVGL